jgi:hypothetical protein
MKVEFSFTSGVGSMVEGMEDFGSMLWISSFLLDTYSD